LIAAKRAKLENIIIPKKNEPNLTEVNEIVKKGLNIILVDRVEDVLENALIG